MNKEIFEKYARLAVSIGINLQKGQEVYINISTKQKEFAKYLVSECYKLGASKVNIDWFDDDIDKLKYENESLEILSHVEKWEIAKARHKGNRCPCLIYVEDSDPNAFKDLDIIKVLNARNSRRKVLKKYRDMTNNKDQWLIIAMPSQEWANSIFPNLDNDEALEKLWEAIIKTTRLNENDPVKVWKEHIKYLQDKADLLNKYHFDYLKYISSNGTDLKIKLHPNHFWQAASTKNNYGIEYVANIPTEEVFTMPLRDGVDGVVCSTKPLSWNGTIIDEFKCYFKKGKCYKVEAKKGLDVLEKLISTDKNSAYLGEVALVPFNSLINMTNVLFYNTLFDENAACHLAFGEAYRENIIGYQNMKEEEFKKLKLNTSAIHVDFMVGSSDLEIKGYDNLGNEVIIFKDGVWAI